MIFLHSTYLLLCPHFSKIPKELHDLTGEITCHFATKQVAYLGNLSQKIAKLMVINLWQIQFIYFANNVNLIITKILR